MSLTVTLSAEASPFIPLVSPVAGVPAGTGKVFWATDKLAGTSNGVFQFQGGKWRQSLAGREVLALGEFPGGWWAAGAGYVALASGVVVAQEEEFYSGCAVGNQLFLAGKQGVWLFQDQRMQLVFPLTSSDRIRLFSISGRIYAYANSKSYVWTKDRFAPDDIWPRQSFRDILTVNSGDGLTRILAYEGLFESGAAGLHPIYSEAFRDMYPRGTVGVYVGKNYAVLASYFDGVRAVSENGEVLWQLGLRELGGNPYSLVKSQDGFLIGTSGGAVAVFSEAFSFMALPGEAIQSVGSSIHLTSGAYDLASGQFSPKAALVENDGAAGIWGAIILPGGRQVALPGREVLFVGKFKEGWVALQDTAITYLTHEGETTLRLPVLGADAAVVDSDTLWVGSSAGLYKFDGQTVSLVDRRGPVRVQQGESAPAFISGSTLSFPNGKEMMFPGQILAVDRNFAAVRVGQEVFAGRYDGGHWKPLDIPAMPVDISHLKSAGDYLYAISPHGVLRIQLSKTALITTGPALTRSVEVTNQDYESKFPIPRPAPWPRAHYAVMANGESVPVLDDSFVMPRLPFGKTTLEVTESIAGLEAKSLITLERNRPWWLSWPGGILYLCLVLAAIWGFVRWRTRRLSRQAKELQRLVDERTRELGEALKAREFFFSSVSHEIRNPLNGVVGLCDMLNESSVGARERLLVKTLKSCSDQLRRILDDVLDFSRIDRGDIEFHPETFDLGPAVEGAARAVDPSLSRVQMHTEESIWVEGDVGKLRQVVTNLVSNALKYGQPSLARIEIKHRNNDAGYVDIQLSVSNAGPDLPANEQSTIFLGFQRGEEAKRQRLPGEGLGLALSQRIMRAMKGDISVRSQGGLTTFTVSIALPPGTPTQEVDPTAAPPRSSKALAIEDEHYNRLVLGHLLGQMGYEVDWAVDGTAALEAVKTGSYDLILTDYMLPDMDGTSLTRLILSSVPAPPPPVVMVTAYSTKEKQDAAYSAGVSGFVTKPVTLKKLQAALLGLGYGLRGRRSLDMVRAKGRFDFAVFHRMNDGRGALGKFADDFESDFQSLLGLIDNPEGLRKAAHALRGRSLVVHATSLAEQFAVLEGVAQSDDRDQITRVLSVIETMVQDLAGSSRNHLFSSSDFGEPLHQGVSH